MTTAHPNNTADAPEPGPTDDRSDATAKECTPGTVAAGRQVFRDRRTSTPPTSSGRLAAGRALRRTRPGHAPYDAAF